MTDPSSDLTWQQVLAAHADGELDATARRRAEEWLRSHPAAATELSGQRDLSPRNEQLWNVVEPPGPSEARWNEVRAGIERRLFTKVEPHRRPPRNRWLKSGLLLAALTVTATAAAAVVVASLPPRGAVAPNAPGHVLPSVFDHTDEVFSVAKPDDVDIVSIRHADSPKLVVGQAPVREPLVLVAAGDVTLDNVQPNSDGNMPLIQMGGTDVPGILAAPRAP